MKCPNCNGTGKVEVESGIFTIHGCDCVVCYGTGVVEPMTNEEWLRQATTEQLAEFLFIIGEDNWLTDISNRDEIVPHEKDVVEWLKQPHNSPK